VNTGSVGPGIRSLNVRYPIQYSECIMHVVCDITSTENRKSIEKFVVKV
jgi:hypothetical protein